WRTIFGRYPAHGSSPRSCGKSVRPLKAEICWRAATRMLSGKGAERFSSFADTIMIEGQQLPEHLNLKNGVYQQGILTFGKGGGRFVGPDDVGKPNVLLSTKIARDYPNADGSPKKPGDSILIGGKPFHVIGIYETGSFLIDMTIVMEISTARELLNVNSTEVSAFYIEPEPPTKLSDLSARITQVVDDVQVRSMSQFNMEVGDVMGKLNLLLLLAVGLALLVGAVGIANTMLMSAMERFVEFGVMRANGWTRWSVLGLVTTESAMLGLLSGLLGSVLAFIGVTSVNAYLSHAELRLHLEPGLILASTAAAVAIALLSGVQ